MVSQSPVAGSPSCGRAPATAGVTDDDRAWARALYDAGRQAGVSLEVVHRACDHDLVAVPMDDVAAPAG